MSRCHPWCDLAGWGRWVWWWDPWLRPPRRSAGAAPARPPTQTVTFDVEGAHSWTVPPGVNYATIDAYGASGGGNDPGLGARVRATIAVSNGQTFTIVVAGEGGDPAGQTRGAGGFGGGGAGGAGGSGLEPFLPAGPAAGGGGGASDVRSGPADDSGLASRLLVAAGGGGAGSAGGGAGGLSGAPGADGSVVYDPAVFEPVAVPGGGAAAGSVGAGHPGADGPPATFEFIAGRPVGSFAGAGGGGGGGGLVGGGGGAAASSGQAGILRWTGSSSGGGGGSSLMPATTDCPTVVEDGVRAGDGLVVITFHKGNSPQLACG
jgi:Glycine rich protein